MIALQRGKEYLMRGISLNKDEINNVRAIPLAALKLCFLCFDPLV